MSTKPRTSFVVTGIVSAILAVGFLVVGGALVWADHEKDSHGYLTTSTHRFQAGTAALATDNLDVNLGGADWVVGESHLGKVRLKVDPANGRPVFAGIARTEDVDRYLRGVAHTNVTDIDYKPFKADYSEHAGAHRRPAVRPADAHIWSASVQGPGRQTLDWKVRQGNWSVVVMNADGTPGVTADINAGASLPFLTPLAWGTLGIGALLGALAAALLVSADRSRGRQAPLTPAPAAG